MTTLTGAAVARREDVRFLTGRGRFVDDLHPDGLLHAAVLRSSWAHARLVSVDVAAAAALPGVAGVFCHGDVAAHLQPIRPRIAAMSGFEEFLQFPIAGEKLRYVGEPIAVVVASDPAIAEDALELIEVVVESLPAITDHAAAVAAEVLVHDAAGTNISSVTVGRGDAESCFRDAAYTRRERFTVHRHTASPMETRGLLASWDGVRGEMTVHGITKVPFFNRTMLAAMLDLPEAAVIMKVGDAGGGFGVRGEFYPEDFLIPFLARRLGAPVKWIEDRREHFLATNHARETSCELAIACDRDGVILGLRADLVVDIGAYARGTGGTAPTRCAQFLPGPYRIPHFACTVTAMVSNKTPSGSFRGPGRVEANFFRERLIDMAAVDLNIDPAELRRRNFVTAQEMPFDIGRLVTYDPPAQFDSGDFAAVFEQALEEIGWERNRALQGREVDGWLHGIGFAAFVESSAGGPSEHARLCLAEDGRIDVFVGSTSTGQGHETVFAQLCADALEVTMEDVRVTCASTDQLIDSMGTYHSRSAVMAGNAVLVAAGAFRERLLALAGAYFGRPNDPVAWRDGAFHRSGLPATVSLAELARFAAGRGETVDVTDRFHYTGLKPFSYGTHAAHVALDPRTGRVKLLDFIAIEDIGRVLNPLIAHGQALGAIVQGLGGTFMEHLVYDADGQLLTASFADYLLPTADDFPAVRAQFSDFARAPGNPLGAKGAGEGGIVAVAAAIGNAVSAALSSHGVQVRDLPLTPPRLWSAIWQKPAAG
jgi:aerobic carbon-monoxide dehydrogenase large subunit